MMPAEPFWRTKTLAQMSVSEWESLCDGCGLCCLIRYEDEDTGVITPTRVACRLFDGHACRCRDYENRREFVPDCIKLTPGNVKALPWMPKSCAYRRLAEGRGLASWHPLVSGDPESVHKAGVSIRNETISEDTLADPEDALDFMAPDLMIERGVGTLAPRARGSNSGDE
ncbi:MAG TPA: YcgN family cysteine cluster protein [Caulobacteraceae bacterium]